MHLEEGFLVLEEIPPSIVGNRRFGALGLVVLRDPQGSVICTSLARMRALPIPDCVDGLASLGHGIGSHCCTLGGVPSRAAVFASGVLSFSAEGGVVEAEEGVTALTQVELEGSRH